MNHSLLGQVKKYLENKRKQKIWKKIVMSLAVMVVFVTTYMLVLPALTMTAKPVCGKEEHTHTEKCYKEEPVEKLLCEDNLRIHKHTKKCYDKDKNLICGKADFVLHKHTKDCYNSEGKLVCPLKEEEGHKHTKKCYDKDGKLICKQLESYEPHKHTKDCYKDKDGKVTDTLQCGKLEVEEHTHTKECYPEVKKVLICGKEEHTHTDACYEKSGSTDNTETKTETAKQLNTVKTESGQAVVQSVQTNIAKDDIDFTQYITSATVSKLDSDGEWKPSTEFTEGDQVRVKLEYRLPAGTIAAGGNQTIYYQLPKGVAPFKAETGKVYQGLTEVGTYVIDSDGMVKITFNDEFDASQAFIGDLQFEGTVSKTGTGDSEQINFGGDAGNITVKKDTENYDISTKKESKLTSDNRVKYTVTVSSSKGTMDNTVTIKDTFVKNTASGAYDKDSFTIWKVDENGNKTQVTNKTPSIGQDSDGNQNFTVSDLPALAEGEKYIVEYEADAKETSANGSGTVSNKAGAETGKKDNWSWSSVEISKAKIFKEGYYDKDKGLIHWKVYINEDRKDIGGYTFKDTLPQDLVGKVTITGSDGKEVGDVTVNGKEISYKFPDGSKDKYTIEYWTKAPDNDGTVSNNATIGKDGDNYNSGANPDVVHRKWNLSKQYTGVESSNDKTYYKWQSVITLPDGAMGSFTYTDTIEKAVSEAGTSTPDDDSHYAVASELQAQLEQLKISLSIDGSIQQLGYNNDYVNFDFKYYDKDGNEISATDNTSKVRKFTISVTPKEGHEDVSGTQIVLNYSTIINTSQMNQGDTWKFTNNAAIPDHTAKADHDYTIENPIEKQNGINHGSWMEYKDGAIDVDYDQTNGILYYRLLIHTKATDNGEITLTDTLPEGATLVENSVTGAFYGNANWHPTTNYQGYDFNDSQKITYTVDGQTVTMKIAAGYNDKQMTQDSAGGNTLEVMYQVSVKDDDFWQNMANSNKTYTNKVEWNGNSAEQTTTVDKEVDKVQKSAEQLKDENGKLISAVRYKIVINPAAEDLLKNEDWLTLTDTMTIPDKVDAYLDLSQVKLYQYDASKEGNLGEEISSDRYKVSYDQKTHQMTVKVPDELACVLVYRYDIDAGNKNEPQLSNKVSLSGLYEDSTGTKVDTSSSSATVTQGKLTIYKVDSEDYKKLLSGAKFSLEYWDGTKKEWVEQAPELVTGDSGEITLDVASSDEKYRLEKEKLYRLTETKAPDGYQTTNKEYYFIYKGYQKNGEVLSNDDAYKNAKADSSGVQKGSIDFYGRMGGIMYVPNEYTRVSVKKVWVDNSNQTTDPISDSVKVKLYRQKTKLDGCMLQVNARGTGTNEVTKTVSQVVVKGSSATISVSGWNRQYQVYRNGELIQEKASENGYLILSIDNISDNTVINIVCTNGHQYEFGTPEITKSQPSNKYVAFGDKEEVSDEITLSDSNNWTYSWDNLTKKDPDTGNPYYYTIEETDAPKSCKVSYTNNDGIKTGEIIVTNKTEAYKLPETGGFGTTIYTKAGILFIIAGMTLLYWKRKYQ
ncbi:MAG: SpaA isopeptide-forming pilin-related protein [Anaerostipes hadrus]